MATLAAARSRFFHLVRSSSLWPLLTALALFGAYAALACRHLYWTDSAEFVLVAKSFGIAHPSGYPLYSLLASLVARGSWPAPFALSLLSALFAALGMGALARLLMRLGAFGWQAALASAALGFYPDLVLVATTPEVYSLHLLLQMLCATALVDVLTTGDKRSWMRLWGWLGLSLANHLISVWFFAPLAFVFWVKRRERAELKLGLRTLSCLLPGLALYMYLPLRAATDPLMNQGDPDSLGKLFAHVSGSMYRYRLFTLSGAEIGNEARLWWESLRACWGVWAVPLAGIGAWAALHAATLRRATIAGLIWLAAGVIYTINYYIPDKEGYYLIPHLLVGMLAVFGAWRVAQWLATRLSRRHAGRIRLALALGAAALAVILSGPISRADNHSMRDFQRDVWRNLEGDTLLISESLPLVWATMYAQMAEEMPAYSIAVSEYYLGFEWYRDMLARLYPQLRLPPALERLGTEFVQVGDQLDGERLGKRRQELARRMSAALIEANIDTRPVAVFIMDTEDEPSRFEGYPLQNAGLVYKVVAKDGMPPDYHCDFAGRYRAGKSSFEDERERYLAGLYATACNRLGIYEVKRGDYDAALKTFESALAFDPDYAQAMKNKGLVLVRYLKRVEEGKLVWKRYLDLAGDDADAAVKDWMKQATNHE